MAVHAPNSVMAWDTGRGGAALHLCCDEGGSRRWRLVSRLTRRYGEEERMREPDDTGGTDSPMSAEHDCLSLNPWPHVRATRTPSPQSLTFPPGRAGRERRLSGRVRVTLSDMR